MAQEADRPHGHQQLDRHIPHPHIAHRQRQGPHLTTDEHVGFNGWLAIKISNAIGTMYCFYAFNCIAFVGLPTAVRSGPGAFIQWLSSNDIQLVLLPLIIVADKISQRAADKRAVQQFNDTSAILHEVRAIQAHLLAITPKE